MAAISLVNSQAEVMFGFRREELIGQDIHTLGAGLELAALLQARSGKTIVPGSAD